MTENSHEPAFDFRRYGQILRKRIWVVVTTFTVVSIVTLVGTLIQPRIYRATATVLIERQAPNVVSFQEVLALGAGNYYDTRSYYETQFKIILSRRVAQRVLTELKLDREMPYAASPDPVATLLSQVTVDPVKNSYLVEIAAEHVDPEKAARIANAFAEIYMKENLAARTRASEEALTWLTNEGSDLQKKLRASEEALLEFKKTNDIVSFEERQDIVSQKIADLTTAYTDIQRKRIEAESLYNRVREYAASKERAQAIPSVLANTLIQELKAQQIELERQYAELSKRYKPMFPEMQRLDAQRQMLAERLTAEIGKIVKGAEADYLVARDREQAIEKQLDALKAEKQALDEKQIEYNALARDVQTNRNVFEALQKRTKEAQVSQGIQANNVRIIDAAEVPKKPVRPRRKLNVALGMALGLLAGVGLVFAFEYLDNTIKTQDDLERVSGLPFLGIIPSFRGEEAEAAQTDLFAHEFPKSSVTESCRVIRTSVLFASPDRKVGSLLVTSANPQEGKSTTVINLGIVLAQGGKRVLIVDSDLRRPRLHHAFRVDEGRPGLTNLVMGEVPLEDVIVTTQVPGLSVVPCGPIPPTPAELLGSHRMQEMVEAFRARYEWVLFDSPPVAAVTDAVVLSRLVEGVILVVKAGRTTREMMVRARRRLQDVGAPILGTVLNDFNLRSEGYRYYYYAKYGK